MKKIVKWIVVIVAVIVAVGLLSKCVVDKNKEEKPSTPVADTLNARLENANGEYELEIEGEIELVSAGEKTLLGGENVKELVIDGWNEATIRAVGTGSSIVKARNNATLIFRNLTIVNALDAVGGAWWDYLWFGGGVRFENCDIQGAIYLTGNARAEFENCTFNSGQANKYAAWVADGSASFYGCTFTGYRGLKIHEFEGGDDVVNVEVDNCLFDRLSEKPGLAIGQFLVDPLNTTVAVRNSKFQWCNDWDTEGSLVGVDSFYECDVPLDSFNFIAENNEVLAENQLPPVDIPIEDDERWTKNY